MALNKFKCNDMTPLHFRGLIICCVCYCGRLRELLESERAQYAGESVTTQETTLERQCRLRERARQLREKREAERNAFVEEKYEQQFR